MQKALNMRRFQSRLIDGSMSVVFAFVAVLTVILLLGIFLFLVFNAVRALQTIPLQDILLSANWNPVSYTKPVWGILALALGTLIIVLLSLLVAFPLGLLTAIYLSEIASVRSREILKPLIEMIAGVPSVVLGLLGLLFLAPILANIFQLSNGLNALTASMLVAIVTMPSIASLCEDSLSELPRGLRDASFALGAGRASTIIHVLLPAAKSGIAGAAMLGLGRAIGETMIVLMVAGNSLSVPRSLFDAVRPMTATIAIEIKEAVTGSMHWSALFVIGLILFLLTLGLNIIVDILVRRRIHT